MEGEWIQAKDDLGRVRTWCRPAGRHASWAKVSRMSTVVQVGLGSVYSEC